MRPPHGVLTIETLVYATIMYYAAWVTKVDPNCNHDVAVCRCRSALTVEQIRAAVAQQVERAR